MNSINLSQPVSAYQPLQEPLNIHPLSLELFKKIYSYPELSPSQYQLRQVEDLGSMKKTLKLDKKDWESNILYRKPSEPRNCLWLYSIARVICQVVFVILGAAAGSLYHPCQALRFLGAYLVGNDERNLEKAKAHFVAGFADFKAIPLLLGAIPASFFVPKEVSPILYMVAEKNHKAGLFRSIALKNNFGITGKSGEILSFDPTLDINPNDKEKIDPFFTDLYEYQADLLLTKLKKSCRELKERNDHFYIASRFETFKTTGNYIPLLEFLLQIDETTNIREYIDLFETLEDLLTLMNGSKYIAQSIGSSYIPESHTSKLELNFQDEGKRIDLYIPIEEENSWETILKATQKTLEQIQSGTNPLPEELLSLKEKVLANSSAEEMLGFTTENLVDAASVEQKFRQLSLATHPDKHPTFKEEATAFFTILSNAKEELLAKLNQVE